MFECTKRHESLIEYSVCDGITFLHPQHHTGLELGVGVGDQVQVFWGEMTKVPEIRWLCFSNRWLDNLTDSNILCVSVYVGDGTTRWALSMQRDRFIM